MTASVTSDATATTMSAIGPTGRRVVGDEAEPVSASAVLAVGETVGAIASRLAVADVVAIGADATGV